MVGAREFQCLTRVEAVRLAAAKGLALPVKEDFSLAEAYGGDGALRLSNKGPKSGSGSARLRRPVSQADRQQPSTRKLRANGGDCRRVIEHQSASTMPHAGAGWLLPGENGSAKSSWSVGFGQDLTQRGARPLADFRAWIALKFFQPRYCCCPLFLKQANRTRRPCAH